MIQQHSAPECRVAGKPALYEMNRPNDFSVPFHHITYGKSCLILYNIMNETESHSLIS